MTSSSTRFRAATGPQVWRGAALGGKEAVAFDLEGQHVRALDAALAAARATGRAIEAIGPTDFPLGSLEAPLAGLRREVLDGRGVVIVRGVPVERYGEEDAALAFWGLGTHLGHAVSQSLMGDRIGHVVDVSGTDPRERGYRSRKALDYHTDSDNLVAMLCLRPARSGGVNRFVNALAVHNEMLAERPDLLGPLYRGFHYHWRGEEAPGEPPVTAYRVPVFSECDGELSCVFLRAFIDMAADEPGGALTGAELEALEDFTARVERPDMALELTLERGEAFLINNLTLLHSRTEFVDHVDPAHRRHLLRLWLKTPGERAVAEPVRRYYREDGITPRADGAGHTLYESSS